MAAAFVCCILIVRCWCWDFVVSAVVSNKQLTEYNKPSDNSSQLQPPIGLPQTAALLLLTCERSVLPCFSDQDVTIISEQQLVKMAGCLVLVANIPDYVQETDLSQLFANAMGYKSSRLAREGGQ